MIAKILQPFIHRVFNQDEYLNLAIQRESQSNDKYCIDTRPFLKFEDKDLLQNEKTTSE